MAELRNDILKEEEQFGGFNPGEPDDDTFLLKDKPYPGNIALFLPPVEVSPEKPEDVEAEDENSVEDTTKTLQEAENEEELFEYEKNKLHKNSNAVDDELNDPNFIGYMKGLMAGSKRKSKSAEEQPEIIDEASRKPFVPVEGNSAETNVSISDMNLDRPSTAGLPPLPVIKPEDETQQNISEVPKEDEFFPEEKPKKEKKKKKYPLLILIPTAVAALLLLTAGLMYLLMDKPFDFNSHSKKLSDSVSHSSKKEKVTVKKSVAKIKTDSIVKMPIAEIKPDTVAKEIQKTEPEIKSLVSNEKKITVPEVKTVEAKLQKPENKKPLEIIAKNEPVKTEKKIENKPSKTVKTPEVKNAAINITKNRDLAESKPDKKAETEFLREKAIDETFEPKDEPGIYIVQIYSSPSKEDAQNWLAKLKNKNAPEAFISEQNVRDKVWYRVRFGNYRTREEAKNAALRYGFAQTWIDRAK